MMNKLITCLSTVLLFGGIFSVALADNNLCHTVWAGQCQTQRQWEAGHCYANYPAATCDAIYSDVVSIDSGQLAELQSGASPQSSNSGGQNSNGGQAQQFQGRSLAAPQAQQVGNRPPSQQNPSQPGECQPGIAGLGYSDMLGAFNGKVRTCGRLFGTSGSGGKLIDERSVNTIVVAGTRCSLSLQLFENSGDKSKSLYAIGSASPAPCDQLSFWISGS